jgi:hypothetical protein
MFNKFVHDMPAGCRVHAWHGHIYMDKLSEQKPSFFNRAPQISKKQLFSGGSLICQTKVDFYAYMYSRTRRSAKNHYALEKMRNSHPFNMTKLATFVNADVIHCCWNHSRIHYIYMVPQKHIQPYFHPTSTTDSLCIR